MNKTINNPSIAATRNNYELQRLTHPITSVNADSSEADLYNTSVAYGAAENDYLSKLEDNSTVGQRIANGFKSATEIGSELGESAAGSVSGENDTAKSIGKTVGAAIGGLVSPVLGLASIALPNNVFRDQFHSFMSSARSAEKDSAYYDAISANEDKDKASEQYQAVLDLYGKEYEKERKAGIVGEATQAIRNAKTEFDSTINDLNKKISEGIANGNQKYEDEKYWENKGISDRYKIKQQGNIDLTDPDTYIYRLPGLMGSSSAGLGWQIANMAGSAITSASIGAMYGSTGAAPGAIVGAVAGAALGLAGLVGSRENESGMEAFGGYRDKVNNLLDHTKGISKDYVANTVKAQLRRKNPNNFNVDSMSQDELIDLAISGAVQVPNKQFGDILTKARHGVSYVYDSNNTLATTDLLEFAAMVTPVGKLLTEAKPLANAIGKVSEIAEKLKLNKVANIASGNFIKDYLGNRVDDVANWAINKTSKDFGTAVAKKGIFDKVTGIAAKTGLVTLSEASEEGVQDMIRDDFQNGNTGDGSNYLAMWLKNTGRAVRSTFAAFTPWDPVYSSDKDFINDYKGGALLGGMMSVLGIGARNIHSLSHPMSQYNTDKLVGTLFADQTAIKDGINKSDTYARLGKTNGTQRVNQAFDDLKSIKPDWLDDKHIEDERDEALKVANIAASEKVQDMAKEIGIDVKSDKYDRFVSLSNYYEKEADAAKDAVEKATTSFDSYIAANPKINKLLDRIVTAAEAKAKKTNQEPLSRDEILMRAKQAFVRQNLYKQADLAGKLSDSKKELAEKYGITLSPQDLDEYNALATELADNYDHSKSEQAKEQVKTKSKSQKKIDHVLHQNLKLVQPILDEMSKYDDINTSVKELSSALVQQRFADKNSQIFSPEMDVKVVENKDENGKPILDEEGKPTATIETNSHFSKKQGDEINKRIDKSLKVTDDDNKAYNDNSVPTDLKEAVDEEKATSDAVKEQQPAIVNPTVEQKPAETTIPPAPVAPVQAVENKPTEALKPANNTVNQPTTEKPVESLKMPSTAKSEGTDMHDLGRERARQERNDFEKRSKAEAIHQTLSTFADKNLRFDEEKHEYTDVNNPENKLVSVTTVKHDTDYAYEGNAPEEIVTRAAKFGTAIHALLEQIANTHNNNMFGAFIGNTELSAYAFNTLNPILKGYYVVSAEQMLGSLQNGIAGTSDLILINKQTGKLLIVDYKTEEARDGKVPFWSKYNDKNTHSKTTFDGYYFQLQMYKKMVLDTINANSDIKLTPDDIEIAVLPISYKTDENDNITEIYSDNKETPLVRPTKEQLADTQSVVDTLLSKIAGKPDEKTDVNQIDGIPVTDDGKIISGEETTLQPEKTTTKDELPNTPDDNDVTETVEQSHDENNGENEEVVGEAEVSLQNEVNAEEEQDLSSEGRSDISHLLNHIGLRNKKEVTYLDGFGPKEGFSSSLELDKALCSQGFIEDCDMQFVVKDYKGKPAIYCVIKYVGKNKSFVGKKYVTTVFDEDSYVRNINRINLKKSPEDQIDVQKGLEHLINFRNKIISLNKRGFTVVPNGKIVITNGKFNTTKLQKRQTYARYNLVTNNTINGKELGRVIGFGLLDDSRILDINSQTAPNIGISFYDRESGTYVIRYPGLKTNVYSKETHVAGGIYLHVSGRADQKQWLPGGYKNSVNIPIYGNVFSRPQCEFLLDLMTNNSHSVDMSSGKPLVRGTNLPVSVLLNFMINAANFDSPQKAKTVVSYILAQQRGDTELAEQLRHKIVCRSNTKLYLGESPFELDETGEKTVFNPNAGINIVDLQNREVRAKVVDFIYNNLKWNTDQDTLLGDPTKEDPVMGKVAQWFIENENAKELKLGETVHGYSAMTFKREHFVNSEGKRISSLGWLMLNSALVTDISPVSQEDINNGMSTSIVREPFVYVKDVTGIKPNEPAPTKVEDTVKPEPVVEHNKRLNKAARSLIDEVIEASEQDGSAHSEERLNSNTARVNTEAAKQWLANKLGLKEGEGVEIVKDASIGITRAGLHIMGACTKDCITLSTLAKEGTEYHEAWHRVSNLLISKKSRENIYNRFRKQNHSTRDDAAIDEIYAEQFREFMLNSGSKIDYDTKNWFKRIANFIKTWSKVGNYRLAKIYYQINTGKFANVTASDENVKRFKEIYGDAGAPFVLNGHRFKFIPNTKTFNSIVDKLLNIALTAAPTLYSIDKVDFSQVESTIRQLAHNNKIDEKYRNMYLEVYAQYKDVFLPELTKRLKAYSILVNEETDEASEQLVADSNEDKDKSLVSDYIDLSYEKSRMHSVSAQMRLILSSVEKYIKTTDSNGKTRYIKSHDAITGFTETRDYREVFNKLINNINDVTNASELIKALRDKAQSDSFYNDVLQRLSYATLEDKYVYEKLVVLLHCHKHDFVTIEWNNDNDKFSYSIINNTIDKKSLMYPRVWSSFFVTNTGIIDFNENGEPTLAKSGNGTVLQNVYDNLEKFVNDPISEDATDVDIDAKKVQLVKLLQSVGITVDENSLNKYIQNYLDVNDDILADQPYCLQLLNSEIQNSLLPRLKSVLDHSANGKNISNINIDNKNTVSINKIFSKLKFVSNLSKAYASTVIENSESMALGTENKKLYQMADDSFATTRTNELDSNTDGVVDDLSQTPYSGKINSQESVGSKYEGPCKNASLVLDQIQESEEKPHLSLETFINFKENSVFGNDGDYFDVTDAEDYIMKLVATSNDRIVFPTTADKKTYFFLKGVKLFHQKAIYNAAKSSYIHDVAAMQRLRAYCFADMQTITECYKDLYSENKLPNKDKIANYHTATAKITTVDLRDNSKVTKKLSEPNGLRFRFLTELPVVDPKTGIETTVDLNNPDLTVNKRMELAKKYFFDLSEADQLDILQRMIDNTVQKELDTCVELGIIETNGYRANSNNRELYKNILLPESEMNRYGYNPKDSASESDAVYSAIANNCINTIISVNEVERTFTGDPAFYKQTFTKTINKSGKSVITCDRSTDKIKRLGGLISTGTNCLNYPDRQDYACTEVHVGEVGSTMKPLFDKWFKNTAIREAIAKTVPEDVDTVLNNLEEYTEKYPELSKAIEEAEKEAESAANSYGENQIDTTDGGAFISPAMYRDLMKMNGKFSDSTALAFKLLTEEGKITLTKAEELVFIKDLYNAHYDISKFGYKYNTDEDSDEDFIKTDEQPISFDNPASNILNSKPLYTFTRNTVLSPLKFVAYGTRFNNGLAIPNFDKFALFPLFKSLVADTTIENLYNRMVKTDDSTGINPIDMVMMDTAVKVGSNGVTDFYKKFDYDNNTGTVNDLDKLNVYTQKFKYLRHQLETNPHEKSTEMVGTQMMKQALSNVVGEEMYGKEGDQITGHKIIENAFGALNKLSNLALNELAKTLYNGEVVNKEELYKMILRDAIGSDANDNVITALTNGDSLSSLSDISFVESKIISFINKKTVDVNLPGGAFIQRPPLGMNSYKVASEEARDHYILNNGNRLNDVNEDGSLNCCISITMFKDVIPGYKNKSLTESRNWLIEHNIIGDSAEPLAVGYRIPTQAAASVSPLKIMDILPDNMGDTIILPEFFTKITGSDFDVDKLYVIRYNIGKDGNVLTYDKDSLENNTDSHAVENFLIHNYMRVLLTENKQGELKNSIDRSTKLLKDTLAEIEEDNEKEAEGFANEYTPAFQLKKKHDYTSGKTGIGPMALQSVHHILTQSTGLAILNTGVYDVDPNGDFSYEKFTNLSRVYDNRYTNDTTQNRILDWFSGLINAFVDIAKDPYITRMNINAYTYDAVSYLLRLGLGKRALYFINNPIIRELAEQWNVVSGSLNPGGKASWSVNNKNIISSILAAQGLQYKDYTDIVKRVISESSKMAGVDPVSALNDFKIECAKTVLNPYLETIKNKSLKDVKEAILSTSGEYDFPEYNIYGVKKSIAVLFAWDAINKSAKDLSELIKISKIDTKKAGNTIVQQHSYLLAKDRLEQNAENGTNSFVSDGSFGLKNFFDSTFITTKINNSVVFIKNLFSKHLITDNDNFLKYVDQIVDKLSNNPLASTDLFRTVSSSTLAGIKSKFFNEQFTYSDGTNGFEGKNKMFYGEGKSRKNSMARRLARLKSEIRSGVIPNMLTSDGKMVNDLLEMLEPYIEVNNPAVPDFIKFSQNLDTDATSDNNLINNFQDLLEYDDPALSPEKNAEIRNFAHDLIAYAFYTSGDNANFNYIFKYVPHSEKLNIGYVKYITDQLDSLNNGIEVGIDRNEIFKNNWLNTKVVPEFKFFNNTSCNSYNGCHFLVNDNGATYPLMFVGKNENNASPYITIKSMRTKTSPQIKNLYKLVGYVTSNNEMLPVYQITSKLGYKSGGFTVVEYGSNTMFDQNKVFIPNSLNRPDLLDLHNKTFDEFKELCNLMKIPTSIFSSFDGYDINSQTSSPILTENTDDISKRGFNVNVFNDENSTLSSLYERPFDVKTSTGNIRHFHNVLQYVTFNQLIYLYNVYNKLGNKKNADASLNLVKQLLATNDPSVIANISGQLAKMPSSWVNNKLPQIMKAGLTNAYLQNPGDIDNLIASGNNSFNFTDDPNTNNQLAYRTALSLVRQEMIKNKREGNIQYMSNENSAKNRVITKQVNTDYEVSSKGDKRFSALYATFNKGTFIKDPNDKSKKIDISGMTIEHVYQSILKNSKKGLPPAENSYLNATTSDNNYNIFEDNGINYLKSKYDNLEDYSYYKGYLPLWKLWADQHPELINELENITKNNKLKDSFAKTSVNQARALTDIINMRNNTSAREQQIYTNHSGGANGADSYWQNIGEKYGVKTNAYYSGEKTPQGNIEISKEDYDEGRYEAAKAAKRNYGYNYSTMKNDLLIRNWSQVKHADSIFAISNIVGKGEKIFPDQKNDTRVAAAPSVTGGTGYAVGMAINHWKPVYVYNQGKIKNSYEQGWYRYDYSTKDFVKTEVPTLTNNFAGIGSRTLSQNDIKQIENVYSRTFSNNISSREQQEQVENKTTLQSVEESGKSTENTYEQLLQTILDNAPRDKEGHLLAPNNEPTKLTDRQYAQVRTDEFKKWFGDWETFEKINNARVIWGHPGTGKTWMFNNDRDGIIDFDSEYKVKLNKQLGLPEDANAKDIRKAFRNSNPQEYKNTINKLFDEALEEAKKTNKKLLVSDLHLLTDKINDIDVVTNISDKEFIQRSHERGEHDEANKISWKNSINEAIKSVPSDKVVNTSGRISDLIRGTNVSKVVDEETKEPLVVYHGSMVNNLTTFKNNLETQLGIRRNSYNAFYFANNANFAESVTRARHNVNPTIYSAFLNIKNPKFGDQRDISGLSNEFDGIINPGFISDVNSNKEAIVWNPNQIKSATENPGTFNANDNSINDSRSKQTNEGEQIKNECKK